MRWRHVGPRRGPTAEESATRDRQRMVAEQLESRGLRDEELLSAFRRVPRHRFVESDEAYGDRALPVGSGQTISQPYVVARMTAAARPPTGWRGARVLEVGTGSGYQAALLAEMGAQVISVERHPELAREAAARLSAAGYGDVEIVVGDGSRGWPEKAPYAAILVTAAGPSVPEPLLQQLSTEDGRLVMPIGGREHQLLTVVERRGSDATSRVLDPVVFVPLIGEFGFPAE
ncbi:MAG: protein-L-isoaspartate(D-aspartate) O-methyltransferase [Chloroflexota bacterium]|nr:protein-L-isoaspartate(D-aspartate) O-methyltransferase [Chloroflexota bacterium]